MGMRDLKWRRRGNIFTSSKKGSLLKQIGISIPQFYKVILLSSLCGLTMGTSAAIILSLFKKKLKFIIMNNSKHPRRQAHHP